MLYLDVELVINSRSPVQSPYVTLYPSHSHTRGRVFQALEIVTGNGWLHSETRHSISKPNGSWNFV